MSDECAEMTPVDRIPNIGEVIHVDGFCRTDWLVIGPVGVGGIPVLKFASGGPASTGRMKTLRGYHWRQRG